MAVLSVKKFKRSEEANRKHDLKDSADDFIQGKNERINLNNSCKVSVQSEYLKRKFIKKKNDLSSFIPKDKEKSKDHFYKLGTFKTNIGRVSVGFERFRGRPKFRFTLISSLEDEFDDKYSQKRFDDPHNFFKKNYKEKQYKENKTTLEFDPQEEDFSKVFEDHMDNKMEDEVLYDDTTEDLEIESLQEIKESSNLKTVEEAISDIRQIKNEKREDNLEFENELRKFISSFTNNKLKKFEDADQLQRAKILISSSDLYLIKKRIEMMELLCKVIQLILKKKGVD